MKTPGARGLPINNQRYDRWLASFTGYADQVTRRKLELWLDQFDGEADIAARVLDAVLFVDHNQVRTTFRQLLESLPGWDYDERKRKGRWFFVPFSSSVGESGDTMVHIFRMATTMTPARFSSMFIHRSELVAKRLTPDDTVVLIDDFSGTGTQATGAWKNVFSELLAEEPRVFLLLVAATAQAASEISNQTPMNLVHGTLLHPSDNVFDPKCNHFSSAEKAKMEFYCKRADARIPKGSGGAGLLLVFSHRCPNNSLPILHANHDRWSGLFPRNLA